MKIEIKNQYTEVPIFAGEYNSLKEAVEAAVKSGVSLRSTVLRGADLFCADLRGADLAGADMRGADLFGADLRGADMSEADLRGSDMRAAICNGADMGGADLHGADLSGSRFLGVKAGVGGAKSESVGPRPAVQIWPIGPRNDSMMVFWCGDAGVRISTGRQLQVTEPQFLERLERLADTHGAIDQASAQHYIEALAFAKRLLKDQTEGKL